MSSTRESIIAQLERRFSSNGGKGKSKGKGPPPVLRQPSDKAADEEQRRSVEQQKAELRKRLQDEREEASAIGAVRWQQLQPCDLDSSPWRQIVRAKHVYGGSGGVVFVEVEGDFAACLKPQTSFAIAEYFADRLAALFSAPVARLRLVTPESQESSDISCLKSIMTPGTWPSSFNSGFFGVLQYVPGFILVGEQAHDALNPPAARLLEDLGRMCAYDVLINNMDRMPLPVWSCAGNHKNIMVRIPDFRIVGVDQAVRIITHEPGLRNYMARVRAFVSALFCTAGTQPDASTVATTARLQNKLWQECGVKLSSEAFESFFASLRQGFQDIASSYASGEIEQCLVETEDSAKTIFALLATFGGVSHESCRKSLKRLVRNVSGEIWAAHSGVPLASTVSGVFCASYAPSLQVS
eukprot:TRINITY_DN106259_c0_g1_i1.p1 TRINITY_DN106259_c0_g1~~TRINITY_DN106259_c0_g1_i1.p1  ORF type:complete len:411 (-),score=50.45 TRINITY_DN106259_c0_g1_i1:151-1383(-)